ncbi:MAG: FtsX-like permease family protein [Bacteroidales bacterium]|nr:FtsX-like permease family protein [Bacteroidales bacterium]
MKTYLKFLSRNKLYTAIEFIGLSVALAFVIIAFCYVMQQYAITKENPDRERIYAVSSDKTNSYGMKDAIDGKLPEIECVSRFQFHRDEIIKSKSQSFVGTQLLCDRQFFDIFPVKLVEGNPDEITHQGAAFISEDLARKMDGEIIGRELIMRTDTLNIVGVFSDLGSSLMYLTEVISNFETSRNTVDVMYRENLYNWFSNINVFLKVRPDTDRDELLEKLKGLYVETYKKSKEKGEDVSLMRLDELFFSGSAAFLRKGDKSMLKTMTIIGLLLLISALINYINLNLALTGKRAKEMASRRLLGAQRIDIIGKYLAESFAFTLCCFVVGLLIAEAILPVVNQLLRASIEIRVPCSIGYLFGYLLIVVAVSLLAGLIPAFIIAQTQPIDVVRGTFRYHSKMVLSKIFIVLQNVLAIALIALVLTMELQMRHMVNRPMGLNMENLYFHNSDLNYTDELEPWVNDLRALPCVKEIGFSENVPGVVRMKFGVNKMCETDKHSQVCLLQCDKQAFKMFGFEVVEQFKEPDENSFWITENTVAGMTGMPHGVNNFDTIMAWKNNNLANDCCGVIKDFNMYDALHATDEDYAIVFGGDLGFTGVAEPHVVNPLMEIVGDHKEAKKAIDALYKKHCEAVFGTYMEPDYNDFISNVIAKQYDKTKRQMRLIELIMGISVLLSLLGLVAMSTHFASEREKTIAVRKVFGGTMQSEIRRNLKEYIVMILIANAIAIPVSVWLCKRYLEDFAYRIDLYPWIFMVTAVLSFVIAIGSVLWQIVSVARVNPVNALKKE